jgi:hypothetical protein
MLVGVAEVCSLGYWFLSRGMKGEALSAAVVTLIRATSAKNCHDPASSLGKMRTGPFNLRCQICALPFGRYADSLSTRQPPVRPLLLSEIAPQTYRCMVLARHA